MNLFTVAELEIPFGTKCRKCNKEITITQHIRAGIEGFLDDFGGVMDFINDGDPKDYPKQFIEHAYDCLKKKEEKQQEPVNLDATSVYVVWQTNCRGRVSNGELEVPRDLLEEVFRQSAVTHRFAIGTPERRNVITGYEAASKAIEDVAGISFTIDLDGAINTYVDDPCADWFTDHQLGLVGEEATIGFGLNREQALSAFFEAQNDAYGEDK